MPAYHDAHVRDALDRIALQARRIADNVERLVYVLGEGVDLQRRIADSLTKRDREVERAVEILNEGYVREAQLRQADIVPFTPRPRS